MDRSFPILVTIFSGLAIGLAVAARGGPPEPAPDPAVASPGALEPPPDWSAVVPGSDGLDWPVGAPDAQGYYDAQPFGRNDHLGEDWNGLGGGDTDLGDPVFAIGHGWVSYAGDAQLGWGNVVRVVHRIPPEESGAEDLVVESLYAHLDEILVEVGEVVTRGQRLGSIGDAGGLYPAHLHLELRERPGMALGGGYSRDRRGYLSPSAFIAEHRPARP